MIMQARRSAHTTSSGATRDEVGAEGIKPSRKNGGSSLFLTLLTQF